MRRAEHERDYSTTERFSFHGTAFWAELAPAGVPQEVLHGTDLPGFFGPVLLENSTGRIG
jgi:hypothetical protein